MPFLVNCVSGKMISKNVHINILNELGGRRWVFLCKLMSDLVSNASVQCELPGSRVC